MIPLPSGTKIWLVAGITDMRNGFNGLAAKVQTALKDDPMSGHVFIFRGRSGSQVKLLWSTGDGLCLLTKRLERGRFAWPSARDGKVFLTQAQLAMLPSATEKVICIPVDGKPAWPAEFQHSAAAVTGQNGFLHQVQLQKMACNGHFRYPVHGQLPRVTHPEWITVPASHTEHSPPVKRTYHGMTIPHFLSIHRSDKCLNNNSLREQDSRA
ncbi:prophage CP-933O IS protein [Escherichia coli]|nr:prophage CP-933O IS protein [Escherichia coli]